MVGSHLVPGGLLHPNKRGGLLRVKHTTIKERLETFWRDFRRQSMSHSCSHFRTTT